MGARRSSSLALTCVVLALVVASAAIATLPAQVNADVFADAAQCSRRAKFCAANNDQYVCRGCAAYCVWLVRNLGHAMASGAGGRAHVANLSRL